MNSNLKILFVDEQVENFDYIKVNSVTDITGFGLLGHALEMAKASNVSIEINSKDVPILDGAIDMANIGIIPAGMYRNKEYISKDVNISLTSIYNTIKNCNKKILTFINENHEVEL